MSDANTAEAVVPDAAAPAVDKRAQAETLLTDILKHMDYPARLEWKEMPDGGLGVAVHFEGELPGITPGKRSYLLDCLQFLVNKVVNRPNTERRWVSLGANAFPEPRPLKPAPGQAQAPDAPPPTARPSAARRPPKPQDKAPRPPPEKKAPERRPDAEERALEVPEDAAFSAAVHALAEKCARWGRPYALVALSADDRARALKAAAGVAGIRTKVEGDGILRRVAFIPEKPAPLPKRTSLPDDADEEE